MKDLHLFRMLLDKERPLDPGAALPLLHELAALPVEQRFPFCGVLAGALDHDDGEVAAAAVRALRGSEGPYGLRRIVTALADPRPPVALAAVEALRESCATQPARWIHAVFHPEPAVRVAAASGAAPPQTDELFGVYLLADPACRDEVLRRLSKRARADAGGEGELNQETPEDALAPIATPPPMLPALLELTESGAIPRPVTRRFLAGVSWSEATRWIERGARRSEAEIQGLLDSVEKPEGPDAALIEGARDAFDAILDLFWEGDLEANAGSAASPRSHTAFWNKLGAALQGWKPELVRRVMASILRASALVRSTPRAAAGLCAVFHPPFLKAAWVPRGVRHGAVAALYTSGSAKPNFPDEDVRALIASDLARRPSGRLDLWVVGGLLRLVHSHPYKRLLRWVKLDEVLSAFAEDPEYAAPLLCLKDESKLGRDYLIARIDERCHLPPGLLRALLALAAPSDELEFLRSISPTEAAATSAELVRLLARPGGKIGPKKSSALARILGDVIVRGAAGDFLRAWLKEPAPDEIGFGLSVLGAIGVAMEAEPFVEVALGLEPPLLQKLLNALPYCHSLPFGKELALARSLAGHEDEAIQAWCSARMPVEEGPPLKRAVKPTDEGEPLSEKEKQAILVCSDADLPKALARCLDEPRRGLTDALAQRRAPASPSVAACAALLGAHDEPEDVAREFARFGSRDAAFLSKLDAAAVRAWEGTSSLPLLGHAWLHRWERHAFALVEGLETAWSGMAAGLARAASLPDSALREQVWEAAASVLAMWRWRKKTAEIERVATDAMIDRLIAALAGDLGEAAAKMLIAVVESQVAAEKAEARRPKVLEILPDLSAEVRHTLSRWVESQGLAARTSPRKRAEGETDEETRRAIRGSIDFDALEAWCSSETARIVEDAALRLLELGEPGAQRLLRVLKRTPPIVGARIVVETIPLWPEGESLLEARAIAHGSVNAPGELRFRLSLALVDRGDRGLLDRAIEAARADANEAWFRPEDWDRLVRAGIGNFELAIELAPSPHPHAYRRAVGILLEAEASDATAGNAVTGLRSFLEAGTQRSSDLRRKAAQRLKSRGDFAGFPVLLQEALDSRDEGAGAVLAGAPPALVIAATTAVLTAGTRRIPEAFALRILDAPGVNAEAAAEASELLLADALHEATRAAVLKHVTRGALRATKLRKVAETFAWGVLQGRELTGRVFAVRMISGSELGYTRFDANHIFVTPLPILRAEPHGRTIVEALILHELGHHMYHRGDVPKAAWDAAQKEGIFGLLNLVADEHLERNLRALSADYGDRLKRLAAYAFQHTTKEIPVADLLGALGGHAFGVLTHTRLDVARREGHARVHSGPLLLALERSGRSFPRFMRALRMGLGNRHRDPIVDAALDLFKGNHKRRSMQELLDIARKLRDLFGWQASLVESFGTHESMPSDRAEEITHGEGITAEELEAEIERVLDPRSRLDQEGREGDPGGRRWINVSPDEAFTTISTVVKVPFDPAAQALGAASVARHARQMRRYLEKLGLSLVPERRRLTGRRFDTTRTLAVVLRGDPRMLVARRVMRSTDLFLGVLIDCSGSMQTHGNIDKAKLFGNMLAEAARGLHGVDLAVFGFTHDVLYDAGDASRCAVHGLVAEGGNNDAAALWHAAGVAKASRRRAKLLVMISDGLPTECSVEALRSLVSRLHNRARIACAQVAVQPLTEVCFPHYVVLNEADPDAAVRRFGLIIASLVQKTLAGA